MIVTFEVEIRVDDPLFPDALATMCSCGDAIEMLAGDAAQAAAVGPWLLRHARCPDEEVDAG